MRDFQAAWRGRHTAKQRVIWSLHLFNP